MCPAFSTAVSSSRKAHLLFIPTKNPLYPTGSIPAPICFPEFPQNILILISPSRASAKKRFLRPPPQSHQNSITQMRGHRVANGVTVTPTSAAVRSRFYEPLGPDLAQKWQGSHASSILLATLSSPSIIVDSLEIIETVHGYSWLSNCGQVRE